MNTNNNVQRISLVLILLMGLFQISCSKAEVDNVTDGAVGLTPPPWVPEDKIFDDGFEGLVPVRREFLIKDVTCDKKENTELQNPEMQNTVVAYDVYEVQDENGQLVEMKRPVRLSEFCANNGTDQR